MNMKQKLSELLNHPVTQYIWDCIVWQKLILLTQAINVILLFGKADEELSCRAYRLRDHYILAPLFYPLWKFIDKLFWFEDDHCKKSYEKESLKLAAWER